jgi:hypothetical protein
VRLRQRPAARPLGNLAGVLPPRLRSPRPLLIAAALGAPFALAACTAQDPDTKFEGAKAEVRDVVTKLSDLADDGKAKDICSDLLTETLQNEFAKAGDGDCAKAVDLAVRNADYTQLTVDKIDLNGTDAKATTAVATIITQTDGPKRGIRLVHSDTKAPWLIDAFISTLSGTSPAATSPAATSPTPTTP